MPRALVVLGGLTVEQSQAELPLRRRWGLLASLVLVAFVTSLLAYGALAAT